MPEVRASGPRTSEPPARITADDPRGSALTYAYVVNRPGIEKSDRLRVKPGDSASSLFIDKIKGINGSRPRCRSAPGMVTVQSPSQPRAFSDRCTSSSSLLNPQ